MDRRTLLIGSLGYALPAFPNTQSSGKSVCLMIGVEKYDNPRVSPLQYAAKDVTAVANVLKTKFSFSDVRLMTTDTSVSKDLPKSTNVLKVINQLVQTLEASDTFVFYFSGHGYVRDGKTFLATQDADPSDSELLERTTLPLESLQKRFKQLRARQVIMIIDACRNDPEKGKGDRDNLLQRDLSKDLRFVAEEVSTSSGGGSAILFACSEGERAYEDEEFGQSVFTKYLLEAFDGKAASLSVDDVVAYTSSGVQKWAKVNGNQQTPDLHKFGTGKLAFGTADMVSNSSKIKLTATSVVPRISPSRFVASAGKFRDTYPRLADYVESLCVIPSGEFQMGSNNHKDEAPVHKVSLSSFAIGSTPVTVAVWKEYAAAKLGGQMPNEPIRSSIDRALTKFNISWRDLDHPIVYVSWDDCSKFCRWASEVSGMRIDLPSEAQWEYACRGGKSDITFPWGGSADDMSVQTFIKANVWCSDSKSGEYIGTGRVNRTTRIWRNHPWGLVDMIGNVWEWCLDWYDPEWYGRPQASQPDFVNRHSAPVQTLKLADGTKKEASCRIVRGGSWQSEDPDEFRCANRDWFYPDTRWYSFGFRLCVAID